MKRKPKSKKPAALPDPGMAIVLVNPPPNKGGRVSFWLTPERIQLFESLLGDGNTITTACGMLGISEGRFYSYLQTGRAVLGLESFPSTAPLAPGNRELCRDLLEAVTRARATAMARAVNAVKIAIEGAKAGERTTVTYSETMLDRNGNIILDKDGNPQMYVKTTVTEKVISLAPDWRAGIEFLARRDSTYWAKTKNEEPEAFEQQVVTMIKSGQVEYETLMEQFDDEPLVLGWFELAGVVPVIKKG